MKTVLLFAFAATGSLLTHQTVVAGSMSLWPTQEDKAICNHIFSELNKVERSIRVAEAENRKPSAGQAATQNDAKGNEADEKELTTQLAQMLQACSYDGKALKLTFKPTTKAKETEGAAAVSRIMRYTGLPQNFTVMESDVPNASAVIVVGTDGVPRRVIAYNKQFMQQVAQATGEDDWPRTSILAHEIGHHLSGHTLLPGGSQPPIELEADKFSGFVLFKMGATLPEATKAISTLIPILDGPTHPGRRKRLAAVEAGWALSCEQQNDICADDHIAAAEPRAPKVPQNATSQSLAKAPAENTAASAPGGPDVSAVPGHVLMPDIPGPFDDMPPLNPNGNSKVIGPAVIDHLPKLDADTTPMKFDRFVYDEAGVFDPAVREKLQTIAFQFAAAANVEVVTIAVKDLQDRDADQFALDFMRQMRVGKLDVGNGAVLVVAPQTKEIGLALGPGLKVLFENDDSPRRRLQSFVDQISKSVSAQKISWTLAGAAYRVMSQSKQLEWHVRYASFAEYEAGKGENLDRSPTNSRPSNAITDPTLLKLLRLEATVVSKAPDISDRKLMVNEPRSRSVGPAMHVRTPEGTDVILYVNESVPELMPVPLEVGRRYAFVARDTILETGAPQLDLISYDLLQ